MKMCIVVLEVLRIDGLGERNRRYFAAVRCERLE
jgi:hypothetical protein